MKKQYICYQDKSGKPAYREATPEELANMQINEPTIWHYLEKSARICFTVEQYRDNMQRLLAHNLGLENHPYLASLVTKVQSKSYIHIEDNNIVYYYCEYIDDTDKANINNYGGYIEIK